ncbi:hypothetical protein [Methylobacterium aerolatum]|uniref:Uncharacterized protein n=1 Tax=Methylobacterium aerolatum TaxID=418708 RepID=A0ABU0I2H9_9HYPH|nr:hypothetical protein [Methylobacterium aerolatum]MDQ0448805.1 hypothetical protein [Methylobacterium aerolatum]GJD34074.1 hypothetical protein FMGBMHLM_0970 [Methylobacterium aerolatum]
MSSGATKLVPQSQSRTISVGKGIFALRYVASTAGRGAPRIEVEPFTEAGLSLIAAPGSAERVLNAPGECIFIRAEQPTKMVITASGTTGTLEADLQLERLDSLDTEVEGDGSPYAAPPRIDVLAHVSRRGDVPVEMGEWIGGPSLPCRIEGLTIRWHGRPPDVDLLCTVVSRGLKLRRFNSCGTGTFAGTRGEAAPLVGISIELSGRGASRYVLEGQALFLGSPVLAASGPRLQFTCPTGREALVGLRFTLATVRPRAEPDVRPTPAPPSRSALGRVRMFRGVSMTGR